MPEGDWTAREVCASAGAVVVSVDYRLAVGGVCYPVPHEDTAAAVACVRDPAGELGVDAGRITIRRQRLGTPTAGAAFARDRRLGPGRACARLPGTARLILSPSPSLAAVLAEPRRCSAC
jgi:hypothetical protein